MHTNVYRYIYTMCVPRYPLQLSGVTSGEFIFFFSGKGSNGSYFKRPRGLNLSLLPPLPHWIRFWGFCRKKNYLAFTFKTAVIANIVKFN